MIKPMLYRIPLVGVTLSYLLKKCCNYKTVVFVISTGRSGTAMLAKIFEAGEKTLSLHEPKPVMHRKYLLAKNKDGHKISRRLFYRVKTTMILSKNIFKKYHHYIESNHIFIKAFHHFACDFFKKNIKVIYLERDPVLVAKSLYELNAIPGNAGMPMEWYLDYKEADNALKLSHPLENTLTHDFYKCLWYCYEIKERYKKFKKENPEIEVIEINTDEFNHKDKMLTLFNKLNIRCNVPLLEKALQKRENTKETAKKNGLPFSEYQEMHQKFLMYV